MQKLLLTAIFSFVLTGITYAESGMNKATIHCKSAGSLIDSLKLKGYTDLSTITNLSIQGALDARDFVYIKKMEALDSLDISEVKIEAYHGYGTYEPGLLGHNKALDYPANAIPINAFNHKSSYNNSLTGLEQLTYVKLPPTLTEIGYEAFANCINLSEIDLPDKLEVIDEYAFSYTALRSVRIPASVTHIDKDPGSNIIWSPVFDNCPLLERIDVDKDNTSFKSIDGVLFSTDENGIYLRQYPTGRKDTEYVIPERTTWLCHNSFSGNETLQAITIASSVERLERAFWNCPALTTVNCKAKNPPIWYAFGVRDMVEPFDQHTIMDGLLIVPKGTKEVYERDQFMSWGMFKNIKEEDGDVANEMLETESYHISAANGQITIKQTGQQQLDISIYTYTGRLLYKQSTTAPAISFPVDHGHYIIRINNKSYKISSN